MFYRKYRPQNIEELDNQKIKDTLGKALLADNFAHAYLFIGPRGTGKTSAARILAKIVNCLKRKKGEEPCNKCISCLEITKGSSLDVMEIDAASNTGVDDIRDLREKVRLAPTSSKYKVYIIDEVHMLSTSAFNALLKTLEEPPSEVIFVLATTDVHRVPETIISRCLVYNFGHISEKEIVGSLNRVAKGEKLEITKEVLAVVAAQSQGSFRDAQKLLEQLTMQTASLTLGHIDSLKSTKSDEVAKGILVAIDNGDKKEALLLISEFSSESSENIKDLLNSLIIMLRDVLLFRNGVLDNINELSISSDDINKLIISFNQCFSLMRDCPVPQLPLELVISELGENPVKNVDAGPMEAKWQEILTEVKPHDHSLVALLRASRPTEIKENFLTLEVFYKFHKEKLEEKKNRDILEKVVSDIMGKDLKIKFVLTEKG